MESVMINIKDYGNDFKKYFDNKDLLSVTDFLSKVEDLVDKIEELKDEIRELEKEDEWEDDYVPENYY